MQELVRFNDQCVFAIDCALKVVLCSKKESSFGQSVGRVPMGNGDRFRKTCVRGVGLRRNVENIRITLPNHKVLQCIVFGYDAAYYVAILYANNSMQFYFFGVHQI